MIEADQKRSKIMSKTFYLDYVNHCLKFYIKHPKPIFHSDVDEKNWKACDLAIKALSDTDKDIINAVYNTRDPLSDNVFKLSKKNNVNQDTIWALINELAHKIAKKRGLL